MKRFLSFLLVLAVLWGTLSAAAESSSSFTDVNTDDWFYEDVLHTVGMGLFYGTSANTFSPQATMTRAMFVTVLGRHAGAHGEGSGVGTVTASGVNLRSGPGTDTTILCVLDKSTSLPVLGLSGDWYKVSYGSHTGYIRRDLMKASSSSFSDVPFGCWYSPYAEWAYREGVAYATGSGLFSPSRDITREEICAMLYNYASLLGVRLPEGNGRTAFPDDAAITGTYREAVYAMKAAGVVQGYEDGCFRPTGSATRAEVSAMLTRYFKSAEFPSGETEWEAPFDFSSVPVSDLPEGSPVDMSYFDDACFIGHSIVVGMKNFFGLKNTAFYAVNGIAASTLLSYDGFELESTHENETGEKAPDKGNIEQVLGERDYGKVYIMLGTNELSREESQARAYYNAMTQLVNLVKQCQPGAVIYLISITPVTRAQSKTEGTRFTRDNAVRYNQKLKQVSEEQDVHYLDVFTLLADSQGYLPDSFSAYDGIHLLSSQYTTLKSYLRTHTA
jgi:hypothetical protein